MKRKKPYTGRDEGVRRSKLPPGAPGSDKAGAGVQVDKKKKANKEEARKPKYRVTFRLNGKYVSGKKWMDWRMKDPKVAQAVSEWLWALARTHR